MDLIRIQQVRIHAEGRFSNLYNIGIKRVNAEELSSWSFEDAMSFVDAEYALAA
jgi:hypothetical protein